MLPQRSDRDHRISVVAQAMAEDANKDRYVLKNGHQSTGVEPYEHDAEDFWDLATIAVDALTGKGTS